MLSDFRFAFRRLVREPAFALLTIFTLALGLGSTTAMFAAVNAAFMKPLPYPEEASLVKIYEQRPGRPRIAVALPVARQWIASTRTAAAIGAYLSGADINVSDGHDASRAELARVTALAAAARRTHRCADDADPDRRPAGANRGRDAGRLQLP